MTKVQLYKSRVFVGIWHLVAGLQFAYAIYYDWNYIVVPDHIQLEMVQPTFGGRTRFLTYWCLILQTFYFLVALANDLTGTNEVMPKQMLPPIRRIKDYIFSALAFPIAMNVGITFWSLWAINRELVFPKSFDEFFPWWLNHILHTCIMVFILLEMFLSYREYPSREESLQGLITFIGAYLVWLHIIYSKSGYWVYPILKILPTPVRYLFFGLVIAMTVGFYLAGEKLNNSLWSHELRKLHPRKRN